MVCRSVVSGRHSLLITDNGNTRLWLVIALIPGLSCLHACGRENMSPKKQVKAQARSSHEVDIGYTVRRKGLTIGM